MWCKQCCARQHLLDLWHYPKVQAMSVSCSGYLQTQPSHQHFLFTSRFVSLQTSEKTNVALWLYDLIYWSIKISCVTPLSEGLHIRQHRIWARSLGSEFHWLWIVRTTHYVYRVSRYLSIYTVYTCVYSIIFHVIELDLTARLWFPCFCVNTYKRFRLLDCAARIQSEAW